MGLLFYEKEGSYRSSVSKDTKIFGDIAKVARVWPFG
jgi:hypothetical protein